jgi:gluconokinase
MKLFMGVDIGTTSTKAVLFREDGTIRGQAAVSYPIYQPAPGWAEQDPDEIVQAVTDAIRTALESGDVRPQEVEAVGFSAAMHSVLAMDDQDRPMGRAIIWADNRGGEIARKLRRTEEGMKLYRRTGTPIHPMSPLIKLIWLKENDPEVFDKASRFVSIKEYVWHRLTGHWVVDESIASATGCYHLQRRGWDDSALQWAGIRPERLSAPVPVTERMKLSAPLAGKMGLLAGTSLVIGSSDGVLANVGAGAVDPGSVAVTIGTSGAVRAMVDRPVTDPQGRTFCYTLTDRSWVIGGPTNNGGVLLQWLESILRPDEKNPQGIESLLDEAKNVPAGAEGLLCLPFLAGERAPLWNPDARGVFFGLGLHHRHPHLVRAAVEGVAFAIHSIYRSVTELAGPAAEIRVSGGFARSTWWRQILADVMGNALQVPHTPEASALGAAALAMYATGGMRELSEVKKWVRIIEMQQPDKANHAVYQKCYSLYSKLVDKLVPEFENMTHMLQSNRP